MTSDGQAPDLKVTGADMIVGYARVSTTDQSLDVQMDELAAHGCERIVSAKFRAPVRLSAAV
jgi:hypothetical protein